MKPEERTWLDERIHEGPSPKDESARSAWKEATVDAFLFKFMPPDDMQRDDRRKRTTKVRCYRSVSLCYIAGFHPDQLYVRSSGLNRDSKITSKITRTAFSESMLSPVVPSNAK